MGGNRWRSCRTPSRDSEEGRVVSTPTTNADGVFEFRNLPQENYALRLIGPGFQSLTIKSIYVVDGERKALPVLELSIAVMGSCGGRAVLDYMRLLTLGDGSPTEWQSCYVPIRIADGPPSNAVPNQGRL